MDAKNTSFRFPSNYGIFRDRVSLLPFDFRHVSELHILYNKGCQMMQSYPARALDRKLQVDWARYAREGPRVLMSLRVDFGPMG